MKRRTILKQLTLAALAVPVKANRLFLPGEPMATGAFKPTWDSLAQYRVPEWYRDAKFGIWAHWGAQCEPEHGDWYARGMYEEGSDAYRFHVENYGHPSKVGFKDIIHRWKADAWNPDELVGLYKKAGAKYFVGMANHHDNLDNYNSKYHTWNSVRLGPKKDLIGGWAKAAKKHGLHFGVSIHAAHAWSWYETAQGADKNGPLAGVPYDGKLTAADGKGAWWEGLDPQQLYAQNHALSRGGKDVDVNSQWAWGGGSSVPSAAYCEQFYNRTLDLINQYDPDLVYFDDTVLPLWPVSDVGLKIAAHLYNRSMRKNKGKLEAVLNGKILDEQQRKCMVWDIERGQSNRLEPFVWQTDTCIGNWHYDRRVYDHNRYKSAATVIHTLADVVSKNGNLLLSVPVRRDGTIDEKERAIVEGIGAWMRVNGECIYGTRPWVIFGEGPALESSAPLDGPGFNEGKGKGMTAEDIRFTTKGSDLYAITLGMPAGRKVRIKSLGENTPHKRAVRSVTLPGSTTPLTFTPTPDALEVTLPERFPDTVACVLKIS